MAAIIAYVWNDRMVNLSVFGPNGDQFSRTSVVLLQGDENYKPVGCWCEWMPYQVGQAKKDAIPGDPPVGTVKTNQATIDDMVSRFLGWKLPADFAPDCGISFNRVSDYAHAQYGRTKFEPTGTNLLDASQARAMLKYVLGGDAPDTRPKPEQTTAAPSVEAENKQPHDQLPPEYVEILKIQGGIGIDPQYEWVRCKVENSRDWSRGVLVVRDGMTLRSVEMGHNCRRADPPAAPAPDPIEAEIQAKGLTAPRVKPADIEATIASEHYFTASDGAFHEDQGFCDLPLGHSLRLLTFCVLVLRNGFTVTGQSACASPENFDAALGCKIAREDAIRQVWPLMGYALRERLAQGGAV